MIVFFYRATLREQGWRPERDRGRLLSKTGPLRISVQSQANRHLKDRQQTHSDLVMGNAKSGAVSKELLQDLKLSTKFSEAEITQWYDNFTKQCPSGRITPTEFEAIYARFFPESDAKSYAQHVFRSFDTNEDGTLDFREYVVALHMTSSGKITLKLEWAFSLFDVDGNGYLSKSEVCEICAVGLALVLHRLTHMERTIYAKFPQEENFQWWFVIPYHLREKNTKAKTLGVPVRIKL